MCSTKISSKISHPKGSIRVFGEKKQDNMRGKLFIMMVKILVVMGNTFILSFVTDSAESGAFLHTLLKNVFIEYIILK